jgi:hypothetical protein
MTEHKTMNTIIHAAFRRDLARFDNAFDAFPVGSRDRADQLDAAWGNFSNQLHHHHEDEETIFWPALRELGANQSMMGELEGEHARMLGALDRADAAMNAFHADPTAENVSYSRAAFSDLESVIEDHLIHEERDLEPVAVHFQASPQLKAAQRAVRKAHKRNAGTFFAWLIDGADPDTKAGLRREVPPPVLFVVSRVAGRDYRSRIAPVWS